MKTRKWYDCYKIKPKRYSNVYDEYIVMTDMGYIFSATWEKDGWHVMVVKNNKCYFPLYENQDSLVKWMKVC